MSEQLSTERLSKEERAESGIDRHAAELRSGFLGFVAHEIRNPLSTALWSAELLVRLSTEERGGARGEKLSSMCLRALQRLRLLIEDHFLTERLDVGGLPVRPEALALKEVLEGVVAKAAGQVTLEVSSMEASILGDRALLERVLEGLIAISGRGGASVRVAASLSSSKVPNSVVIRLHGAAPESNAIQAPQRGSPSDPSGHALSLYMADKVARAMAGSLEIVEGAYVFTLPALTSVEGANNAP